MYATIKSNISTYELKHITYNKNTYKMFFFLCKVAALNIPISRPTAHFIYQKVTIH